MYISLTLILSSSLCAASLCIQASSWLACHTPLHLITIVCKSVKIKYKFSFLSSSSKLVLWLCRTVLVQNFPYCTERSSINYVMQSGEGGGGYGVSPSVKLYSSNPALLLNISIISLGSWHYHRQWSLDWGCPESHRQWASDQGWTPDPTAQVQVQGEGCQQDWTIWSNWNVWRWHLHERSMGYD